MMCLATIANSEQVFSSNVVINNGQVIMTMSRANGSWNQQWKPSTYLNMSHAVKKKKGGMAGGAGIGKHITWGATAGNENWTSHETSRMAAE